VLLTGVGLGEFKLLRFALSGNGNDEKSALGKRKCGLDRICESGANALAHNESVNDDLDRVADIFIELYFFIKIIKRNAETFGALSP
jgi:hypothetical protein